MLLMLERHYCLSLGFFCDCDTMHLCCPQQEKEEADVLPTDISYTVHKHTVYKHNGCHIYGIYNCWLIKKNQV